MKTLSQLWREGDEKQEHEGAVFFAGVLRLKWRLSRNLFSVPIPYFTAEFGIKAVVLALVSISVVHAMNCDVKGSGNSPSIAVAAEFLQESTLYHKLFAFVTIILTALHGLAYISHGTISTSKITQGYEWNAAFIAMVVLYLLSLEWIHRRFHEFFVRTHWVLFIVILVAAVIHGGVFALVGILPWEIDLVYRLVIALESTVMELYAGKRAGHDITCIRFPRVRLDTGEEFKYKAGQYAFLCASTLSSLKWYPFSFSSSPHEDYATFHIKAVGLIDGPYGNLSIDIEDSATYSHFVIFAEDMGVTSMRSIVNWLHSQCYSRKARILHRLRFVWSESRRWTLDKQHYYSVLLCPTTLNVSAETFFTEIYVARGLIGLQAPLDRQLIKCLRFHCRPDVAKFYEKWGNKQPNRLCCVQINGKGGHLHKYKDVAEMKLYFDVHNEQLAF
ncbi:Riboflavin synthase-like beta-barrel [Phytophthora cactorum]|nr:Riboflavin synthase-like beta-barrel [Phytophthora cactorum]